jgi:hypothetical protein
MRGSASPDPGVRRDLALESGIIHAYTTRDTTVLSVVNVSYIMHTTRDTVLLSMYHACIQRLHRQVRIYNYPSRRER